MKHCRNEHEIAIGKVGNNVPNPIVRFGDGGLPDVMSEIHKAAPTPIPSQGFALALTGQDMVGIALTGSGKTLGTLSLALFTATTSPTWRGEMDPLFWCWLLPGMLGLFRASRADVFTC